MSEAMEEDVKYKRVLFVDIDGVLNCELFYREVHAARIDVNSNKAVHRQVKNSYKKDGEYSKQDWDEYYKCQLCTERIKLLNYLCEVTESVVVISSTWRMGKTTERLQEILSNSGATFKVIGVTPHTGYERGTEISKWLQDNCEKYFGVMYFDFYNYVIIDDDNDMLLTQAHHFFQTDAYVGLTPTICENIRNFFTHIKYPNVK